MAGACKQSLEVGDGDVVDCDTPKMEPKADGCTTFASQPIRLGGGSDPADLATQVSMQSHCGDGGIGEDGRWLCPRSMLRGTQDAYVLRVFQ
jgi:hypothetical protein